MKTKTIAFAIGAFAFLASPTLAQLAADAPMIKTLAENDKLSVTENWLKPGKSAAMASRMGAAIYYIKGGTFEIDYKDGAKSTVTRASGTVRLPPMPGPTPPRISARPPSM